MPLLADAIVECGRRTLSNAIQLATNWGKQEDGKWHGAHVVYGDTDSIFVKLPGRSTKEAFAFGEEFCAAVTNSNPPPIQLKLEKVYAATLLQTVRIMCLVRVASLFIIEWLDFVISIAKFYIIFDLLVCRHTTEKKVLRDEVRV
jgi:DNA polymerase elongation subunit (family B)